jgi:hypothetical protein
LPCRLPASSNLPSPSSGLTVLADLVATREWSEWNYVNEANQGNYRGDAAAAIAGALGWLRGQGLIGIDPHSGSGSAIAVTPAGRRALEDRRA